MNFPYYYICFHILLYILFWSLYDTEFETLVKRTLDNVVMETGGCSLSTILWSLAHAVVTKKNFEQCGQRLMETGGCSLGTILWNLAHVVVTFFSAC